jgi:hypothetical protein
LTLDIDVGRLARWTTNNAFNTNANNLAFRSALSNSPSGGPVNLIYIADYRTRSSSITTGVRLTNGVTLPYKGLTVATPGPIYIRGHYNAPAAVQGKNETGTNTLPASVVGDAISIQSGNWDDSKSDDSLGSRNKPSDTTVNCAFLCGIVETSGSDYSGGVENYPRFMEDWGSGRKFTYNGSMVVMFPSKYATGQWGNKEVYNPPKREWAFDTNFKKIEQLPPGTPMMRMLVRNRWAMIKPNTTTVASP